jgi:hypothetical protein
MLHAHWRMAELHRIGDRRDLTEAEQKEMEHCIKLNADFAWKLSQLYNWSYVASTIDDYDWLHDICAEIDKLEIQYKVGHP